MFPGLPVTLAGLAVIALASLTQGLTGFGFALVSTPLLLLFLPPRAVVPLVLIESVATNAAVLWSARKAVDLRLVWPLLLAGALGVPLGTHILLYLDAGALKSLIGAVIVVAGLAFLLGFHRPIRHQRLACAPIGFASGLLNGSTGMSGPPVVLFLANQEVAKETFRASLVAYFAALNLITIPGYVAGGLLTWEVLAQAALMLPGLALGVYAALRLAPRVDEVTFRRAVLLVVIAAGVLSLPGGLCG
jgi:uncharacterized membrane protein YfcA